MFPTCDTCGQEHARDITSRKDGTVNRVGTCQGHVIRSREGYVKGQPRPMLDKPRACMRVVSEDQRYCNKHGQGSPKHKTAIKNRIAARELKADADRMLAHKGGQILDPLAVINEIANVSYAFMRAAGARVNALDEIRYTGGLERDENGELRGTGTEQLRAEVALFERGLDRAMKHVEILAKHQKPADVDDAKSMLERLGSRLGVDDSDIGE